MRFRCALLCMLVSGSAHATPRDHDIARAAVHRNAKVSGRLPLYYQARPSVAGGWLPALSRAPVVVELDHPATESDARGLAEAGLSVVTRRGVFVSGRIAAGALDRVANVAGVVRVVADGAPFGLVPPLDVMGPEVQAPDVWRESDGDQLPLAGAGQLLCVIDTGIDVFHPMFFRPDGGYWAWRDVDDDGVFTSGVDTLDDGTVLRSYNSVVFSFEEELGVLYDSDDGKHIAGIDWVYADLNGNGKRDMGTAAGFSDAWPSFGEPLFTSDDVDHDAVLDFGERLVALGTSKVHTYTTGAFIHSRGLNMIDAPREGSRHGTASSSVAVGGQRGFGRFVGVAPDADLMMVRTGSVSELFNHTDFCLNRGARVVLHEYAAWQGHFLDGSSPLERVITDSMAGGVVHINPVGNLAGAMKFSERELPRGGSLEMTLEVPDGYRDEPFSLFAFTLLWQGESGDLEVTLTDATGASAVAAEQTDQQTFHGGLFFATDRQDSPRGTARVDLFVFSGEEGTAKLSPGSWRVSVRDRAGSGPHQLVATVQDDQSGWDVGIHFPELASEAYLIGYPATADDTVGVAAYVGHGFDGGQPGTLAPKSGRGTRIDGARKLSVAAPEDPITAMFFEGQIAPMGPFSGTSGASPHVAGGAALLLQNDPTLSGLGVRDALEAGAVADSATGAIPNDAWGFGKLRIYHSLFGEDPIAGSAPVVSVAPIHVDLDEVVTIHAEISDPDDDVVRVELDRNYDGIYDEVLTDGTFVVQLGAVGSHFLKIRGTDSTGRVGVALARIDVHAPYVPSGGLSCAFVRPTPDPGEGAWLIFLLVGVIAHCRHRSDTVYLTSAYPRSDGPVPHGFVRPRRRQDGFEQNATDCGAGPSPRARATERVHDG